MTIPLHRVIITPLFRSKFNDERLQKIRASANPYTVFSNVTIKLALRERFTDEKSYKNKWFTGGSPSIQIHNNSSRQTF